MEKSIENKNSKFSINIFALIVLILCLALLIVNSTCSNCIINWLWGLDFIKTVVESQSSLETVATAIVFSIISFSISKIISQWKETAPQRDAKKQIKQRKQLLYTMSSKELLDVLKEKDTLIYEKLKFEKKRKDE